ncbi:MAG: hypothetical protein JOZ39_01495, partial [Chloroflexi bacterium]|nr:hypothetical protein [Chloroflexota bacterium]
MEIEQTFYPQLNVNISAKLITSLKILQLSAEELSQTIRQEMIDNPALEIDEQTLCIICGAPLQDGCCPDCTQHSVSTESADSDSEFDPSSYIETPDRQRNRDGEDDYDPMSLLASDISLGEYLLDALRNVLPEDEYPIAEYLVGSLDDFGYLTCTDDEVAEACEVSLAQVAEAIAALQRQDPTGIGARNSQECLLLQLGQLEEDGK